MNGYERMMAAFRGEPVDRAPVWLREGFEIDPLEGTEDEFLNGWKHDSVYQELHGEIAPHIDHVVGWGSPFMNRFLMVPREAIHHERPVTEENDRYRLGWIDTPDGKLSFTEHWKRHNNNRWLVDHPVNSIEELESVARVPWSLDADEALRAARTAHARARERLGDRGVLRFGISSPIVVISGLMDLQLFLELSLVHRGYMHELLEEITSRTLEVIRAVFESGEFDDTTANLGGSEQVTPPMMAPALYDELVVPYDGPIIRYLTSRGIPVNVHCHGKVRHALGCMRAMGVDSTDPVEPPPAGDLTFTEARRIAADEVTLIGNLEYDEFTYLDPPAIAERVREIFAEGNRRVVLGASAGPNTHITPHVADNYRAFVEAGLRYGG